MARGYGGGWAPYVPVAKRRKKAEREVEKLRKNGHPVAPVTIEGRTIAKTFWGKAWCETMESYGDYESRLPRGRTYVRNGSVLDLQISPLEIKAMVSGSSIYKVTVTIKGLAPILWRSICEECAGGIDSLIELLQGRFSKGVMEGSAVRTGACFPSRQKFASPAPARTGPVCASTSLRCCTASAPGSTRGRSFCSSCARWTRTIWWLVLTRRFPSRTSRPMPGKSWKPKTFRPCSAWIWRKPEARFRHMARLQKHPSRRTNTVGKRPGTSKSRSAGKVPKVAKLR